MNHKTRKTLFAFLLVLTGLFLIAVVFTMGIYHANWDNGLTRAFLQVVPLPAATVDGKAITISEVNAMLKGFQSAVSHQTEFDFDSVEGLEASSQQREQILSALIENKIVEQIAAERGLSVTYEEIEDYYNYLLPKFGIKPAESREKVREVFGWSEQQFIGRTVRPDYLRAVVLIDMLQEQEDSSARDQIEFVRDELQRGVDFGFLAGEFSDDLDTKFSDGLLGFFRKEELPPWFRDEVFELAEGETSSIINSPDGYHIFIVTFRDDAAEKPVIELRHILIAEDRLSEVLEKRSQTAKIYTQ